MVGLDNKKKVVVIGGLSTDKSHQTDYKTPLSSYFSTKNVEFTEIRLDSLVFSVSNEKFEIIDWTTKEPLSSYDFVMIRGKFYDNADCTFTISRYLLLNKIPFFNDYSTYRPISKLAQAAIFFENKLSFIPTYYSLNKKYLVDFIENKLQFPLVIKDSYGAHGNNNYVVKSIEDINRILDNDHDIKFVAQPYYPNDGDFRVLVIGDQQPLVIKRIAKPDTHLNNTSQGGVAELAQDYLPQEVIDGSKIITKYLNMTVAGVDVIEDNRNGKFYFLEVNSQPQLVTGAFVDEKFKLLAKLLTNSS